MGNKDLKELVIGFLALSSVIAEVCKDGVQTSDLTTLFLKLQGDAALRDKLAAAYEGISQVPAEAKDLDIAEVVDIISAAVPEVLNLIQVLKK